MRVVLTINPQETADLVTFTEEILIGKLHFLCSERSLEEKSNSTLFWSFFLFSSDNILDFLMLLASNQYFVSTLTSQYPLPKQ